MKALASFEDAAVMEGDARHAMDNRMNVTFYRKAVLNETKSEGQGRKIFDEWDYVTIQIPGDVKTTYEARVTREHQLRWPSQYAAYKAGADQSLTGTPVDKLPNMSVSLIATLGAMGIHTVEQLAGLSDGNATGLHGIVELRKKAKAYLQVAEGNLTQSNTDDIAALKKQIADLTAMLPNAAGNKDLKQGITAKG